MGKYIFQKFKIRGSATVEAALIFPLLMFFFVAFIYLTMIHYQNNVLTTETIRAMNRAGAFWTYANTEYENGGEITIPSPFDTTSSVDKLITVDMIKNRSAYRSIDWLYAFFAILRNKKVISRNDNATTYVESRIANIKFKNKIKSTLVEKVTGGKSFFAFGNEIKIDVSRSYINPLINSINKLFNLSYSDNKLIIVSAQISNQAEFNRNVDLIFDVAYTLSDFIKGKVKENKSVE